MLQGITEPERPPTRAAIRIRWAYLVAFFIGCALLGGLAMFAYLWWSDCALNNNYWWEICAS